MEPVDALHVGRLRAVRAFEPFGHPLGEYRGGERAEALAELHGGVYDVLAVVAPRGEQDRPVAKCTLTEFHRGLEPSDDLSLREIAGLASRRGFHALGSRVV